MLKREFLCIHNNEITPLSIELINRLIYIEEQSILIEPKTLLKRMEFINRVKNYSGSFKLLIDKLEDLKNTDKFQKILLETKDD